MTAGARKLALTAHLVTSVGWLGAVAGFLALAVRGLTSQEPQMAQAAPLAMEVLAWLVIVPLAFASFFTGLVSSLGTSWGLLRHYWVVIKLVVTLLSTLFLLLHVGPIDTLAAAAREANASGADLDGIRVQLVVDAGAALLVLLVATALGVYKPRGVTPYGWRKQQAPST